LKRVEANTRIAKETLRKTQAIESRLNKFLTSAGQPQNVQAAWSGGAYAPGIGGNEYLLAPTHEVPRVNAMVVYIGEVD